MNGFSADIVGGGLVNGEHNVFNGFVPVICHSHYVIEYIFRSMFGQREMLK